MGVIRGNTRSLDYSSYDSIWALMPLSFGSLDLYGLEDFHIYFSKGLGEVLPEKLEDQRLQGDITMKATTSGNLRRGLDMSPHVTLRVQVPNNQILTQNLY